MTTSRQAGRTFGGALLLACTDLVGGIALASAAPVVLAQSFTQTTALTQGQAYEFDGWSVAVNGDWLFAGGPAIGGSHGVVNIYQRNNQDRWDFYDSIVSPNAADGDQFGAAIAIDGDTIVVGSPTATSAGNATGGRAYVFRHTLVFDPVPPYAAHDAFVPVTELLAPTVDPGNEFGFAVAIDGGLAVVGAPYAPRRSRKSTYVAAGYAAVFQRDSGGGEAWGHTATVVGDLDANDNFGYAVALSGGNLLVGSPHARVTPADTTYHSGRAYFFNVSSDGLSAVYDHYVGTATPYENRGFGSAVAINAYLAAVGAPGATGGYAASVDVFAFDSMNGGYPFTQQLTSPQSDSNPADAFGAALALHERQLVVGAPAEEYLTIAMQQPFTNVGSVWAYGREGANNVWGLGQWLYLSSASVSDYYGNNGYIAFGSSVAYDGVTIAGGGPLASYAISSTGATFVFSNDPVFANSFDCQPVVICL